MTYVRAETISIPEFSFSRPRSDDSLNSTSFLMYDEMMVQFTSPVQGSALIRIYNSTSSRIYEESMVVNSGEYVSSIIKILPTMTYNTGFKPGTYKIFIQVYNDYSDLIARSSIKYFTVFPAKTQLNDQRAIWVQDIPDGNGSIRFEYHFETILMNYYTKDTIPFQPVSLYLYDPILEQYQYETTQITNNFGRFYYQIERNYVNALTMCQFIYDSLPTGIFEGTDLIYTLDPMHIYLDYNNTNPDQIYVDQIRSPLAPINSSSFYTSREMQQTWSWINTTASDKKGWTSSLYPDSAVGSAGVSTGHNSIYFYSYASMTKPFNALLKSPLLYYEAVESKSVSFNLTMRTIRKINGYADILPSHSIFDLNLLVFDINNTILSNDSIYSGNFTENWNLCSIAMNTSLFDDPINFRLGIQIRIRCENLSLVFDKYVDVLYVEIQSISFEAHYDSQFVHDASISSFTNYQVFQETKELYDSKVTKGNYVRYTSATSLNDSYYRNNSTLSLNQITSPFEENISIASGIENGFFNRNPFYNSCRTWGINNKKDGWDWVTGAFIDSSNPLVYFSNYDSDISDGAFYYRNNLTTINNDQWNKSVEIQIWNTNKFCALGTEVIIPEKGIYNKTTTRLHLNVGTYGTFDTSNSYRIRILMYKNTGDACFQIANSIWFNAPIYKQDFDLELSTAINPGVYYLTFIIETKEWIKDQVLSLFIDNIEVLSEYNAISNFIQVSGISGKEVLGEGPILSQGTFELTNMISNTTFLNTLNQITFQFNYTDYTHQLTGFDGVITYSISMLPIGSQTNTTYLMIDSGIIDTHKTTHVINIDFTPYLGQNFSAFKIKCSMTLGQGEMVIGRYMDEYQLQFSSIQILVNNSVSYDYIQNLAKIKYIHETMSMEMYKKPISVTPLNSIGFIASGSNVINGTIAKGSALGPRIYAANFPETKTNLSLRVELTPYWDSSSLTTPQYLNAILHMNLKFNLYMDFGNGLINVFSQQIYNSDLDYTTNLNSQVFSLDLNQICMNYNLSTLNRDFQLGFEANFQSLCSGKISKMGIEVRNLQLIMFDLPPSAYFLNAQGSHIAPTSKIQLKSEDNDISRIWIMTSTDGVSWEQTYSFLKSQSKNRIYSFYLNCSQYYEGQAILIKAILYDQADQRNESSYLSVIIDKTQLVLSFSNLEDNTYIYSLLQVNIESSIPALHFVQFDLKPHSLPYNTTNIVFSSTDYQSEDGWTCTINPFELPEGSYDLRAIGFDGVQEAAIEVTELIIIHPNVKLFSVQNNSLVTNNVRLDFSIGTTLIDFVEILYSPCETGIPSSSFISIGIIPGNQQDQYIFNWDTLATCGNIEQGYILQLNAYIEQIKFTTNYSFLVDNTISNLTLEINSDVEIVKRLINNTEYDVIANQSNLQLSLIASEPDEIIRLTYYLEEPSRCDVIWTYLTVMYSEAITTSIDLLYAIDSLIIYPNNQDLKQQVFDGLNQIKTNFERMPSTFWVKYEYRVVGINSVTEIISLFDQGNYSQVRYLYTNYLYPRTFGSYPSGFGLDSVKTKIIEFEGMNLDYSPVFDIDTHDGNYTFIVEVEDYLHRISTSRTKSYLIDEHDPLVKIIAPSIGEPVYMDFEGTQTVTIKALGTDFDITSANVSIELIDPEYHPIGYNVVYNMRVIGRYIFAVITPSKTLSKLCLIYNAIMNISIQTWDLTNRTSVYSYLYRATNTTDTNAPEITSMILPDPTKDYYGGVYSQINYTDQSGLRFVEVWLDKIDLSAEEVFYKWTYDPYQLYFSKDYANFIGLAGSILYYIYAAPHFDLTKLQNGTLEIDPFIKMPNSGPFYPFSRNQNSPFNGSYTVFYRLTDFNFNSKIISYHVNIHELSLSINDSTSFHTLNETKDFIIEWDGLPDNMDGSIFIRNRDTWESLYRTGIQTNIVFDVLRKLYDPMNYYWTQPNDYYIGLKMANLQTMMNVLYGNSTCPEITAQIDHFYEMLVSFNDTRCRMENYRFPNKSVDWNNPNFIAEYTLYNKTYDDLQSYVKTLYIVQGQRTETSFYFPNCTDGLYDVWYKLSVNEEYQIFNSTHEFIENRVLQRTYGSTPTEWLNNENKYMIFKSERWESTYTFEFLKENTTFTIDDKYPYQIELNIPEFSIYSQIACINFTWLGIGNLSKTEVIIDGNYSQLIMITNYTKIGLMNNSAILKLYTYLLTDGPHNLSIKVYHSNGLFGFSPVYHIQIDNSLPFISSLLVNHERFLFEPIFLNSILTINFTAYDNVSPIRNITIKIVDLSANIVKTFIYQTSSNFVSETYDFDISDLESGEYKLCIIVTTPFGNASSNLITLYFDKSPYSGNFIDLNSGFIFSKDVIDLAFQTISNENGHRYDSPIQSLAFYMDTENSQIFLGYGIEISPNYWEVHYKNSLSANIAQANFWVNITDQAGNSFVVYNENQDYKIYPLTINFGRIVNGYFIDSSQEMSLSGQLENLNDLITHGVLLSNDELTLSLETYLYDSNNKKYDYYTLANPSTIYANGDGIFTFEIDQELLSNLPTELISAKIPLSYFLLSNHSSLDKVSQKNLVKVGSFSSEQKQIAFISVGETPIIRIFTPNPLSVFNWTVTYLNLDSNTEISKIDVSDLDNDSKDELLVFTPTKCIFYDFDFGEQIWKEPINYLFSEINTKLEDNLISICVEDSHVLFGLSSEILMYNYSQGSFDFIKKYPLANLKNEQLQTLTWGTIGNVLYPGPIVITTQQLLYWNNTAFYSLFYSSDPLLPVISIGDLDVDPLNEIVFSIQSSSGTKILRADYNSTLTRWTILQTYEYLDYARVYDVKIGHIISGSNIGSMIIASSNGIATAQTLSVLEENILPLIIDTDSLSNEIFQQGSYRYTEVSNQESYAYDSGCYYESQSGNMVTISDLTISSDSDLVHETVPQNTINQNYNSEGIINTHPLASCEWSNGETSYRYLQPYSGGLLNPNLNSYSSLNSPALESQLGVKYASEFIINKSYFTTQLQTDSNITEIMYDSFAPSEFQTPNQYYFPMQWRYGVQDTYNTNPELAYCVASENNYSYSKQFMGRTGTSDLGGYLTWWNSIQNLDNNEMIIGNTYLNYLTNPFSTKFKIVLPQNNPRFFESNPSNVEIKINAIPVFTMSAPYSGGSTNDRKRTMYTANLRIKIWADTTLLGELAPTDTFGYVVSTNQMDGCGFRYYKNMFDQSIISINPFSLRNRSNLYVELVLELPIGEANTLWSTNAKDGLTFGHCRTYNLDSKTYSNDIMKQYDRDYFHFAEQFLIIDQLSVSYKRSISNQVDADYTSTTKNYNTEMYNKEQIEHRTIASEFNFESKTNTLSPAVKFNDYNTLTIDYTLVYDNQIIFDPLQTWTSHFHGQKVTIKGINQHVNSDWYRTFYYPNSEYLKEKANNVNQEISLKQTQITFYDTQSGLSFSTNLQPLTVTSYYNSDNQYVETLRLNIPMAELCLSHSDFSNIDSIKVSSSARLTNRWTPQMMYVSDGVIANSLLTDILGPLSNVVTFINSSLKTSEANVVGNFKTNTIWNQYKCIQLQNPFSYDFSQNPHILNTQKLNINFAVQPDLKAYQFGMNSDYFGTLSAEDKSWLSLNNRVQIRYSMELFDGNNWYSLLYFWKDNEIVSKNGIYSLPTDNTYLTTITASLSSSQIQQFLLNNILKIRVNIDYIFNDPTAYGYFNSPIRSLILYSTVGSYGDYYHTTSLGQSYLTNTNGILKYDIPYNIPLQTISYAESFTRAEFSSSINLAFSTARLTNSNQNGSWIVDTNSPLPQFFGGVGAAFTDTEWNYHNMEFNLEGKLNANSGKITFQFGTATSKFLMFELQSLGTTSYLTMQLINENVVTTSSMISWSSSESFKIRIEWHDSGYTFVDFQTCGSIKHFYNKMIDVLSGPIGELDFIKCIGELNGILNVKEMNLKGSSTNQDLNQLNSIRLIDYKALSEYCSQDEMFPLRIKISVHDLTSIIPISSYHIMAYNKGTLINETYMNEEIILELYDSQCENIELRIQSNVSDFNSLQTRNHLGVQYHIDISAVREGWRAYYPLSELPILTTILSKQSYITYLNNQNDNPTLGNADKSISFNLGLLQEELVSVKEIFFLIKGNIHLFYSENGTTTGKPKDLFNLMDTPDIHTWQEYNNKESLMQITNFHGNSILEPLYSSVVVPEVFQSYGFNSNDSIFSLQFVFGKTDNIQSYLRSPLTTELEVWLHLNYNAFMKKQSSYLSVDISEFVMVVVREQLIPDPEIHTINVPFSIDTTNLNAYTIDLDFALNFTILPTTYRGITIPLSLSENYLRLYPAEFSIELKPKNSENTNLMVTVSSSYSTNQMAEYNYLTKIGCSLYSEEQIAKYTQNTILSGILSVKFAMQNSFIFPVVCHTNYSLFNPYVRTTQWNMYKDANFSTHWASEIELSDMDDDGDEDVIISDGSMILSQTNCGLFPLRVQVTKTSNPTEILGQKYLLASLDIGKPHPQFMVESNRIGRYGLCEYNDQALLRIKDYSFDLQNITLYTSIDQQSWNLINIYNVSSPITILNLDTTLYPDGILYLRAVAKDRLYSVPLDFAIYIDNTNPVLSFSCNYWNSETHLISSQADLTISFPNEGSLRSLWIEYNNSQGMIKRFASFDNFNHQVTISIRNLIQTWNIFEQNLTLTAFGIDYAGNIGDLFTINLTIDLNYLIQLDNVLSAGQLSMKLNEYISGNLIDSFNQLIPNTNIDLKLDGLTLGYTKTDTHGHFIYQIRAAELFSSDIRQFTNTSISYLGEAVAIPEVSVNLPFISHDNEITTRTRSVDVIKRNFFGIPASIYMKIIYDQLNLTSLTNGILFDALHFDLLIPSVGHPNVGTTYETLTIRLVDIFNQTFEYALDRMTLFEMQESLSYNFPIELVECRYLSLDIPFEYFITQNGESLSDLSKIIKIEIVGKDNDIHPGFSYLDPTNYMQILGCAGIYALDLLNDASYNKPQGTERNYTLEMNIRNEFGLGMLLGIVSLIIRKRQLIINFIPSLIPDNMMCKYSDSLKLNGFLYQDAFSLQDLTNQHFGIFDLNYFRISGKNAQGVYEDIAVSPNFGLNETLEFLGLASIGVYTDLKLRYMGNPFYDPVDISFGNILTIEPETTVLDILSSPSSGIIYRDVLFGRVSSIFGQIIDNDNCSILDFNSNVQLISSHRYDFRNKCWISKDINYTSSQYVRVMLMNGSEEITLQCVPISNGFFNVILNTSIGEIYCLDPGVYTLRILYESTLNYTNAFRDILFRIYPNDVDITPVSSDLIPTDYENDPNWINGTEDLNRWMNWRYMEDSIVYSDPKSLTFTVKDSYLGTPLNNAPIWLQVGLTPKCPELGNYASHFADSSTNYMYLYSGTQSIPSDYVNQLLIQDPIDTPIYYPYYDSENNLWKHFSPYYYSMNLTNENGSVSFTLDPQMIKNVARDYMYILQKSAFSIENFTLYIRAFYNPNFDSRYMRLNSLKDGQNVALFDEDYIYSTHDSPYTFGASKTTTYVNPYYGAGMTEGILWMQRDDVTFVTAYQEATGPVPITVSSQIVEADLVNGTLVAEEGPDGFVPLMNIAETEQFLISLEIWDNNDLTKIIDGYIKPDGQYLTMLNHTDNDGVVSFTMDEYLLGERMWNRLIPGIYSLHWRALSDTPYYNIPNNGELFRSQLVIKSESTVALDLPSHLYVLNDLLLNQATVSISNTTQTFQNRFETFYPYFTAEYRITNTTNYAGSLIYEDNLQRWKPQGYNDTETVKLNLNIDGHKVTSIIPTSDPWNSQWENFSIPLMPFFSEDKVPISVGLGVELEIDPTFNINYSLLKSYNYSYLKQQAWANYQLATNYQIELRNIQILESLNYYGIQHWNLSAEIPNITDTMVYNLPDSSRTSLDAQFDTSDGEWTYSNDEKETEIFVQSSLQPSYYGQVAIADQALYWSIDNLSPGFNENTTFMANVTFQDLMYIEQKNTTTSYLDFDDGAQTSHSHKLDVLKGYMGKASLDLDQNWTRGIYASTYTSRDIPYDATLIGLQGGEQIQLKISQLYLPWNGSFDWSLLAPFWLNENSIDPTTSIKIQMILDPYDYDAINRTLSWTIDNSDLSSQDHGWNKDLSFSIRSVQLESKFVDMYLTISVLNSQDLVKFLIVKGWITGEENIFLVSNNLPTSLRARMFSTQYIYFYTIHAFASGISRAPFIQNMPNSLVNDMYVSINGSLLDVLDIWDNTLYYNLLKSAGLGANNLTAILDLDKTILDQLFHEQTGGCNSTYWEFGEADTRGLSMIKLRYDETLLKRFGMVSQAHTGFINMYSVFQNETIQSRQLIKTRKVTVVTMPQTWEQGSCNVIIDAGQSISSGSLNLPLVNNTQIGSQFAIQYGLNESTNDFVMKNWFDRFLPAPNFKPLDVKFDDYYYRDYAYFARWETSANSQTSISEPMSLDNGNVMVVINASADITNGASFYTATLSNSLFSNSISPSYRYFEIPVTILQLNNRAGIDQVNIIVNYVDSTSSNPFPIDSVPITGQMVFRGELPDNHPAISGFSINVHFNTTSPGWENVQNNAINFSIVMGIENYGFYQASSMGQILLTCSNEDTFSIPLYPTVFGSTFSQKSVLQDIPLSSNYNESISQISICAASTKSLSVHSLQGYQINQSSQAFTSRFYNYEFSNLSRHFYKILGYLQGVVIYPEWTLGMSAHYQIEPWYKSSYLDLNGDFTYEIRIEHIDLEGKGIFSNGIGDLTSYDYNADGIIDYQRLVDCKYSFTNISDLIEYGNDSIHTNEIEYAGSFLVSQVEEKYVTEAWDLDGNGAFDEVLRQTYSRSSNPVPNYAVYSCLASGNPTTPRIIDFSYTQSSRFSVVYQCDSEGDGIFDYSEVWNDYVPNTKSENFAVAKGNLYERLDSCETRQIYQNISTSDGTLDSAPWITEVEFTNKYVNRSITIGLWGAFGLENVTADFIIQKNVPIITDSRAEVFQLGYNRGTGDVYWYDADNDHIFELGFVVPSDRAFLPLPEAIGVYYCPSGDMKIKTKYSEFQSAGDTFILSYWLSENYTGSAISDSAYKKAEQDFDRYWSTPEAWVMLAYDTAISVSLGMAMRMLGSIAYLAGSLLNDVFARPHVEKLVRGYYNPIVWISKEEPEPTGRVSVDTAYGRLNFETYAMTVNATDKSPLQALTDIGLQNGYPYYLTSINVPEIKTLKDIPTFGDPLSFIQSIITGYENVKDSAEGTVRGIQDFCASLINTPDMAFQTLKNMLIGQNYLNFGKQQYTQILINRSNAIFDAYYLPQIDKAAKKFQTNTNSFDGFTLICDAYGMPQFYPSGEMALNLNSSSVMRTLGLQLMLMQSHFYSQVALSQKTNPKIIAANIVIAVVQVGATMTGGLIAKTIQVGSMLVLRESLGSIMGSLVKETFSEIVTENVMQDIFSVCSGDALDYLKIDAANAIENQFWANVLSNTAEYASEIIGEKLADSKNNAFVNAHFFAPAEVQANARVNPRSAISTEASETPPNRIWSAISTTLKSLAQEGCFRVRRMAGTDSVNSIHRVIQALTVSSLTSEVNSNNLIARSALNEFIVLTSTFTSSFTAKLGEHTLKLFELMRQNPSRTIADFGADPTIMRELGLTGCYVYFEVRDARGAWVRASSSMTLADLVLHNSEIRIGDPALSLKNKNNEDVKISYEISNGISETNINSLIQKLSTIIQDKIRQVDTKSIILEFNELEIEEQIARKSISSIFLNFRISDSIECRIKGTIEIVNGKEVLLNYISLHELTHFEVDSIVNEISDSLNLEKPDRNRKMKLRSLVDEFLVDATLFRENLEFKKMFQGKIDYFKLILSQKNWFYEKTSKFDYYRIIRLIQDVELYSYCLTQLGIEPNSDHFYNILNLKLEKILKKMNEECQDDLVNLFFQYRNNLNLFLHFGKSISYFMNIKDEITGNNFLSSFEGQIGIETYYTIELNE